ncbi:MAG: hypothetical protein ACRDL7_03970, partial [Gaiellaceae bacterium]
VRRIAGTSASKYKESENYALRARFECDSRADTICAGATFKLIELSGQVCDVGGFHQSFQTLSDVPIATVATAYDDTNLQETLILVFPQSLYFGSSMENSLLCPNQLRANGIVVDTCPRQYTKGESLHGIYSSNDDIFFPFSMHGCISYLPSRLPTDDELKTCQHIYLTSDADWDPYGMHFKDDEALYERDNSKLITLTAKEHVDNYGRILSATSSLDRRSDVDAGTLARRWGVSQSVASETLKLTTQRGVRYMQDYTDRRYRTRQAQLRYPHLRTQVYSDTMFSDVKSLRNFICAQVFVTSDDFNRVYPMKLRSDAGDTLNEFIKDIGIPELLITDNAGEETGAEWERVRKYYLIKQKGTEPYSPWQNKAELTIKELKKHFRRIMNRAQAPEALWDFGLLYTSDIRVRTSRAQLGDRTPYEIMKGDTPDISEFIYFDFYQWVKYNEPTTAFPHQRMILGRWLGVAHDVGQALCYWILRDTGRVVVRSTVRSLTSEELNDAGEQIKMTTFTTN